MVRRRASQVSRSAVSGLIGPAPSSSGGCVVAEVHDQRGGAAPEAAVRAAGWRASLTSASAVYCCHSSTRAGLLVERALGLGDAPDGLLEGCALLERQAAAEHEFAPPARPGHAQRAPLVQLLVVRDRGRGERARRQRDRAGRLADRHTRQLRIALRRRELGGGRDLVERQRPGAQRVVERRQARVARRWCA